MSKIEHFWFGAIGGGTNLRAIRSSVLSLPNDTGEESQVNSADVRLCQIRGYTIEILSGIEMTLEALNRLALVGFLMVYFAVMGALMSISMPLFDGVQERSVLLFVMLPAGLIGLTIIAFEKMQKENAEQDE